MSKSLVRVNLGARKAGTPEYSAALKEFLTKMGGAKLVIGAMVRSQENSSWFLFDNSVIIPESRDDDEDANLCM